MLEMTGLYIWLLEYHNYKDQVRLAPRSKKRFIATKVGTDFIHESL
jgi:hypothetical protein